MYRRILVPVDGSATSGEALATAITLANTFGSRLRRIHVMEDAARLPGYDRFADYCGELLRVMRENAAKLLDEGMALARTAGVEVDNMLFDRPGERLGDTVADAVKLWGGADLIVLGTHGRRGIPPELKRRGADQIIRVAPVPVPVLVVRSSPLPAAPAVSARPAR